MTRKFNNAMYYYRLQKLCELILQYLKNKALVKGQTAVGIKGKWAKGKNKGKKDNNDTI